MKGAKRYGMSLKERYLSQSAVTRHLPLEQLGVWEWTYRMAFLGTRLKKPGVVRNEKGDLLPTEY